MTFMMPDESSSPISLMQPDAVFQLGMRVLETMADRQFELLRIWTDSVAVPTGEAGGSTAEKRMETAKKVPRGKMG